MAARFWVGGTGNWDASSTTHWSTSSGGSSGASAPGSGDTVTFDASSGGGTVIITASQNVTSITGGAFTGTLDFNGQAVTVQTFNFSGTGTRSLTLGSSTITVTGANGWNIQVTTNLIFSGASSTLILNNASNTCQFGTGLAYGTCTITCTSFAFGGTPSFTTLTMNGNANKTSQYSLNANITISATLTIAGNSTVNRVLIFSNNPGTARTLTAATVTVSNADFADITGAGAGSWDLSAVTGGSGNCRGNTNITFTTPTTQTVTMSTNQNWSTAGIWTSRVPLPQDTVLGSGITGGTLTADMPRIGTVDFTGATGSPTLATGSLAITAYGSVTLATGMTVTGTGTISFTGAGTVSLTTNGVSLTQPLNVNTGISDTLQLSDTITSGNTLTLSQGKLVLLNVSVTFTTISITGSNIRMLTMGSGTWNLSSTAATTVWNAATVTNLTFDGSGATIKISTTSTNTRTFSGGGLTYGTLTYSIAGSTGELDIVGSNSFAAINFSDASNARSLKFTAATTTTIRNKNGFNVLGTSGKLMTIDSITAAGHTLSAWWMQNTDYLSINNSNAIGSSWYTGSNSVDNGTNTGWIFSAAPSNTNPQNGRGSIQSTLSLGALERI